MSGDDFLVCVPFSLFWGAPRILLRLKKHVCTMMIEVSSEQPTRQFYMHTDCSCCRCSVCCYPAVVTAAPVLLLPAAVGHRVPDGQIYCWFIGPDSSVLFRFFQTRFISDIPIGSTCRIYDLDLPMTSSVFTGMRGAKGGIIPPRRSPPCICIHFIPTNDF